MDQEFGAELRKRTCAVCAECATSYEAVGDMDACAEACHRCAATCQEMVA